MADADSGPLLDVLGQILGSYIAECFDLPRRPAGETREHLEAWRRHALLGTPVASGAPSTGADDHVGSVGVHARQWRGVTGAFTDHRHAERVFVERALADLRDAIWVCVERAHDTVVADETATRASAVQLDRVRHALTQLETGVVKDEITQAMQALQQITATRQTAQVTLYRELTSRVEALGRQLDDARRQSETDALTGLGNRLAFDRALTRQLSLHGLNGAPLCVLMIDLDQLKPINDTFGHAAGDLALGAITRVLHRVFLGEADQLCRLGGDEFAVLLPNSALELANRLAERMTQALAEEPWPYAERGLPLSASIGVAQWQRGESAAEWLARADAAMYARKQERRRAA